MKYTIKLILTMSLLAGTAFSAEKIRILTTTTDLADITRAIAGDTAKVTSIASGKEDPHFLTAKPSYIVKARDADVWIRLGMELEVGWEGPILRGSRNHRIQENAPGHVDVSASVIRLEVPQVRVTRDMGDVHPYGNPHYWLDPLNGRIIAATIADRLTKQYPQHKDTFKANLTTFRRGLDSRMFGANAVKAVGGAKLWAAMVQGKLDKLLSSKGAIPGGWYKTFAPYRGKSIVTYHKSWVYFCKRFGLNVAIELEPKPGIPPSPRHLISVIKTIKQKHVKAILLEPFYSRKSADFVASRTSAKVVVAPNTVEGGSGAESYFALFDNLIAVLGKELSR